MNQKSLQELAEEYAANIAVIDSQIERCRQAILEARRKRRNMVVGRLMRNLSVLYTQRVELVEIQQHLAGYYDEDKECVAV
ncbi:MAG TPA: hypothetical protein DDY98_02525 [Ruminococcaceae bacterium]|nr:hypothetical protein [Oscillospiraceae bacterium]